ncbi:MAG: hypothetical protein KC467_12700 [Marinomonas atlantica]|nr:hypothetical protein [Marinomonas atlantica]
MKNLENVPKTLNDIQNYLNDLYTEVNDNKEMEYLFSYLFRNVSYLSRGVSRNKESIDNFIKSFSWIISIANKLNINLQDAIERKFPDTCPYCLGKPCVCYKTNKLPISGKQSWDAREELFNKHNVIKFSNSVKTADFYVKMINELYPSNTCIWKVAGPTFHFFKVLEELGEVHEAYTSFCKQSKERVEIENELADCFAWLLSAWGIVYPDTKLQDSFITYYYDSCPVCKAFPCNCSNYSDRGELLVKIDELKKYREKVSELLAVAPEHSEIFTKVIEELKVVEDQGDTKEAITAVKQSQLTLEGVAQSLKSVDSSSKSVKSIIGTATEIIKDFSWFTG